MLYKLVSNARQNPMFSQEVISLTGMGYYGRLLKDEGIPTYNLNMTGRLSDVFCIAKLYRIFQANQYALLQTWLYHSDFIGLSIGRLSKIPRIIWNIRCSNMDFRKFRFTTRFVFILLSKLSHIPAGIVANSESGKRFHHQHGYSPKQWISIPNGFDTGKFKPDINVRNKAFISFGLDAGVKTIGMVARFDPMKDFGTFLKAAGQIHRKLKDIHFVLIGKDVNEQNTELMRMITENSIKDVTILLGNINDLHLIYPAFDIFTLTSFGEGFPNVIGEAMSCGVPCVATNVGDTSAIIGETGKIVKLEDAEALARGWTEILSLSEKERLLLGKSARTRIINKFSIDQIVAQYDELYRGLLDI